MRWPQFLLALINLVFALYILILNVFLTKEINSFTFLWTLIYLSLALAISHLYMLYMSNKIDDWYDVESMDSINNLSVIAVLVCAVGLLAHVGSDYYKARVLTVFNDIATLKNTMVPLIGALLCSVILFTSSIKFKKYVTLCKSIDLHPTQRRNYQTAD